MLAISLRRVAQRVVAVPKSVRAVSEFHIPKDIEQQTGRRREELEAELEGHPGFNKDPIIPDDNAGTKENPILVSHIVFLYRQPRSATDYSPAKIVCVCSGLHL
jgi:hypothetical protein